MVIEMCSMTNTSQQTQNICIFFIQLQPNVFDVGSALYKCYTNVVFAGMVSWTNRNQKKNKNNKKKQTLQKKKYKTKKNMKEEETEEDE